MATLERGQETLQLKSQVWTDIVLVASKWGWKPSCPTYFFLATDFEVSAEEANSLADTIRRIWDALSADPSGFKLQPVVNISVLMNVGAFCLKGGFVLR